MLILSFIWLWFSTAPARLGVHAERPKLSSSLMITPVLPAIAATRESRPRRVSCARRNGPASVLTSRQIPAPGMIRWPHPHNLPLLPAADKDTRGLLS